MLRSRVYPLHEAKAAPSAADVFAGCVEAWVGAAAAGGPNPVALADALPPSRGDGAAPRSMWGRAFDGVRRGRVSGGR
jgi:hypothetical protein